MTQVLARRERPIIFSAPMVQAILAGRKTQTRRILKPQPISTQLWGSGVPQSLPDRFCVHARWPEESDPKLRHFDAGDPWLPCPYGKAGDRLWVREAWRFASNFNDYSASELQHRWIYGPTLRYEADEVARGEMAHATSSWGRLRNARFMPRWVSRILLEITEIRAERVQDITPEDARAEGVGPSAKMRQHALEKNPDFQFQGDRLMFQLLWQGIHGDKDGHRWESNPWVWAVSFRVLEPQVLGGESC